MVLALTTALAEVRKPSSVSRGPANHGHVRFAPADFAPQGRQSGLAATMTTPSRGSAAEGQQNKLGNYHCNNRIYSIGHGRWLSPDQAANPSFNLYDYCKQQPIKLSDPAGLQSFHMETKCGTLAVDLDTKFLEEASAHSLRYAKELIGLQINGVFLPNGSCCCWQWDIVLMERISRLQPIDDDNTMGWGYWGAGGDQDLDHYHPEPDNSNPPKPQWYVATGGGNWRLTHSPWIHDKCKNTYPVTFGDLPGWHVQEIRKQIAHEKSADKWWERTATLKFDLTFCAVCDEGSGFGGCLSITFIAGAGGVTLYRPKAHDDPDFFNNHPARAAWNKGEPDNQIPAAR